MIDLVPVPNKWKTPNFIKNFKDFIIPEINGKKVFEKYRKVPSKKDRVILDKIFSETDGLHGSGKSNL